MRKIKELSQVRSCIAPAIALIALLGVGAGPAAAQVAGCGGPGTGAYRPAYGAPRPMTFGQASWIDHALCGLIYFLAPNTPRLPDFRYMRPVGAIYARELNVPTRQWEEGFPGITRRFEWFAIEYHGVIRAGRKGNYSLRLVSDDGSKLFIDDRLIIDNDGQHATQQAMGSADLDAAPHAIRVQYFQGPRFQIALQLYCTRQGEPERLFPDCGIDLDTPTDVRSIIRYDPIETVNSTIQYPDAHSTIRYDLRGSNAAAGNPYPSDCLPSDTSTRCTPLRPAVTPKGWGAYHVLLPGPLVVGIPNPDNLRLAISNAAGDVCWNAALNDAPLSQKLGWKRVGCDGPGGSTHVERAGDGFLMPREKPGALLVWNSSGAAYFAVNGRIANLSLNANRLSEFRDQEGSFEFDVQAAPPEMLGSRTTPHNAPDDAAAVTVAASMTPIDPAKETWQIIRNAPDPQLFERFVRVFPGSEFASQAVAKAAQLRSSAATSSGYYQSSYDYGTVHPLPSSASAGMARGETPGPAMPARYDAYGQPVYPQTAPVPPLGQPSDPSVKTPIYLIAMRDHSISAASAYWVVKDTLHYINLAHEEHQIALNQVDRNLTLQLNGERGVSIELPGK